MGHLGLKNPRHLERGARGGRWRQDSATAPANPEAGQLLAKLWAAFGVGQRPQERTAALLGPSGAVPVCSASWLFRCLFLFLFSSASASPSLGSEGFQPSETAEIRVSGFKKSRNQPFQGSEMDSLGWWSSPPSPGLQTPRTLCSQTAGIWGNSGDNPSVMLVPGLMRDWVNLGTFWDKGAMRWWQPEARPPPCVSRGRTQQDSDSHNPTLGHLQRSNLPG